MGNVDASKTWLNLYAQLEAKIKIYIAPSCKDCADRIMVSSGTRVANTRETTDHAAYEEGASLPREPWRRLTEEEAESLVLPKVPSNMATSVAIIKLPGQFSDDLWETRKSGNTDSLQTKLLQSLRTICELGEPLHCIGPNTNPGNLKTVTPTMCRR
jgi:hypothetical protein